jgi:hypothetical protein
MYFQTDANLPGLRKLLDKGKERKENRLQDSPLTNYSYGTLVQRPDWRTPN